MKITSSSNTLFKKYLSLTSAKGLKKEGLFILSGEKLIREYLKNPQLELVAEIINEDLSPITKGPHTYEFSKSLFSELDVLGTDYNLLILRQPAFVTYETTPTNLEVICPLGDPANVGALIRSCEAFNVKKIILTEESAHPFLPKSVKASAGSVLRMMFCKGPSIKKLTGEIYALDAGGTDLTKISWPQNIRLLVGEEGQGLPKLPGLRKISIKTNGVESLNAFVATTIALYEISKTKNTGSV